MEYPYVYLTAAAAIGMTKTDVDTFISRLEKVLAKVKSQNKNSENDCLEKTDIFLKDTASVGSGDWPGSEILRMLVVMTNGKELLFGCSVLA